ncbi:MAG: DCC1-like thiol-disulfide oxidoreductase family protein, partial [Planctomycetota bacterium]
MSDPDTSLNNPIIFFDGVCGLCNRFVDQVMRHDKKSIFRFAPL